ncbi:hypothetical protein HY487_01005 [Candidatus Woesearchaeota archaeon]|nr:hypothetical protein [Candidatus Woesearchaeota archaeon]
MGVSTVINHETKYYAPTKTYTASLYFADKSTLIIAANGVIVDPKIEGTIPGDFKRAILFGPDETLEAVVEINEDGFGLRTRGKVSQQHLAGYLAAARDAGRQVMADYVSGGSKETFLMDHTFFMITARGPPQEMVDKLMSGELNAEQLT